MPHIKPNDLIPNVDDQSFADFFEQRSFRRLVAILGIGSAALVAYTVYKRSLNNRATSAAVPVPGEKVKPDEKPSKIKGLGKAESSKSILHQNNFIQWPQDSKIPSNGNLIEPPTIKSKSSTKMSKSKASVQIINSRAELQQEKDVTENTTCTMNESVSSKSFGHIHVDEQIDDQTVPEVKRAPIVSTTTGGFRSKSLPSALANPRPVTETLTSKTLPESESPPESKTPPESKSLPESETPSDSKASVPPVSKANKISPQDPPQPQKTQPKAKPKVQSTTQQKSNQPKPQRQQLDPEKLVSISDIMEKNSSQQNQLNLTENQIKHIQTHQQQIVVNTVNAVNQNKFQQVRNEMNPGNMHIGSNNYRPVVQYNMPPQPQQASQDMRQHYYATNNNVPQQPQISNTPMNYGQSYISPYNQKSLNQEPSYLNDLKRATDLVMSHQTGQLQNPIYAPHIQDQRFVQSTGGLQNPMYAPHIQDQRFVQSNGGFQTYDQHVNGQGYNNVDSYPGTTQRNLSHIYGRYWL